MSMNEDRFAGTAKNVGGRVEQGFGRATGDVKTEVEGRIKQATGAAQDVYGQAKDAAGEAYVYRTRFFGHKFDLSGVLHVDFLPGETRLARAA